MVISIACSVDNLSFQYLLFSPTIPQSHPSNHCNLLNFSNKKTAIKFGLWFKNIKWKKSLYYISQKSVCVVVRSFVLPLIWKRNRHLLSISFMQIHKKKSGFFFKFNINSIFIRKVLFFLLYVRLNWNEKKQEERSWYEFYFGSIVNIPSVFFSELYV